jgi:predicted metal-dependent hydrolase
VDSAFEEGIRLFNTKKFFEAHEALEALWLKAEGEEKVFLQGLIQVAAAFHHQARGNLAGARSLLEEGWKKLAAFDETRDGIDLASLRRQIQPWREFLKGGPREEGHSPPPLPQIIFAGDH